MKKIFLMLAFTGLVASVSAATNNDDKDKGKKDTKKETKSCCKDKTATGKSCSAADKKEGKSCCKDKSAAVKPAETK